MIGYDNYWLLENLFIMLIIIHAWYIEWIVQCVLKQKWSFKSKGLLLNGYLNNKRWSDLKWVLYKIQSNWMTQSHGFVMVKLSRIYKRSM
jgi:hypothetical protein